MTHPPIARAAGRSRRRGEPLPPFRERIAALRYVPKLIRLVWETHRGYAATMVVLRLARAFVPVTQLWAWKLIIDAVVRIVAHNGSVGQLWPLVALQAGVVVVGDLLARASSLVESLLGDLFTNRISVRLMEHSATLDLPQFEDPEFYDHLERARRGTTGRIGLLTQLVGMAQDALTLTTLIVVLVA
ncbi:MAG TPA: hypothetical protein VMH39_11210, partial [Gemmatimonadaceae bacterium]|nr:hypothetical protein [Gemmatimonadaceae bacterium]